MTDQEKPHLSASSLGTIARCGLQYEFIYKKKMRRRPGVDLLVGSATHKSVETDLRNYIDNGELLPDEAIPDLAADAMRVKWFTEEPDLTGAEKIVGSKTTLGKAVDMTVALSVLHHTELAPSLDPIHVERGLRLELEGWPYDLIGYLDVQEDGIIRDTKTAGKKPSQSDVDTNLQFSFYSMAVNQIDGVDIPLCYQDTLVKTKKPYLEITETVRTEQHHAQLLRRVEYATAAIESGIYQPAPPGSWWCSEKWCGFWDICPCGKADKKTF